MSSTNFGPLATRNKREQRCGKCRPVSPSDDHTCRDYLKTGPASCLTREHLWKIYDLDEMWDKVGAPLRGTAVLVGAFRGREAWCCASVGVESVVLWFLCYHSVE